MTDNREYCRRLAAPDGSDMHYATLFLPPREQRAWLAAHALAENLKGIVETVRDPSVVRLRLQWWTEEIHRMDQPTHPVAIELAPLLTQGHMPTALPLALIRQAEQHLTARSATLTDNYAASSELWLWSSSLCRLLTDKQAAGVQRLGRLHALLHDLRNLRLLIRLERSPVPGILSLSENRQHDLRHIMAGIHTALTECGQSLPAHDADNPCITACRITHRLLLAIVDEITRDGCRLLERHITLTPMRKLWIAWLTNLSN